MSTVTTLPPITAVPHLLDHHHQHQQHIQRPVRVSSQPQHHNSFISSQSSSMQHHQQPSSTAAEADSTLQQQSKRLAGLSITNSTGAKVSILNDSMTDLASVTRQDQQQSLQPSNTSNTSSGVESRPTQYRSHSYQISSPTQNHHRQSFPEGYDSCRSSSLTNASTPIYSSRELKGSSYSTTTTTTNSGPSNNTAVNGPVSSLRSRSLSSGANKLSPLLTNLRNGPGALLESSSLPPSATSSTASPTYPCFARSYSEDNSSDDAESYRRMSEPSMSSSTTENGGTNGSGFVKRKYSCSFPGCNKCFTTSGHLARHNRIHTGERNFPCLMAGCPSKFSRQDNMMQHYRTHISPKSRRGMPKKQDYFTLMLANGSQEALRDQSPASGDHHYHHQDTHYSQQQHHHVAKMGSSRQGSRHNSPPRFNPFDRSSSVDYTGRNSTEGNTGSGGSLRHRHSGIIQTHQHHTPLPHFNVQTLHTPSISASSSSVSSTSSSSSSSSGTLPSPLTPSMTHGTMASPQPPPAYVPVADLPALTRYTVQQAAAAAKSSSNVNLSNVSSNGISYRSEGGSTPLASPKSPHFQDVDSMEGVASTAEYQNTYRHHQHPYQSQQQQSGYQGQSYGGSRPSHAGHASSMNNPQQHYRQEQQGYQLPPLSVHLQDRYEHERLPALGPRAPPSPQSTPHTPTKFRFDPIQDCLQQDKMHLHRHHQPQQQQQHYSRQYIQDGYYSREQHQDEDEDKLTVRSSVMSTMSSMTSVSCASSNSINGSSECNSNNEGRRNEGQKGEQNEEMSGLAHLAQVVATFG